MAASDEPNDDSDDLTVPEIRSRLIAAAHGQSGDAHGNNPLVEETQRKLYRMIRGEELPEEHNSNQVRFALLQAVDEVATADEFLARGTSPFRKTELKSIWSEVSGGPAWGPVGSEEVDQDDDGRSLRKPEATERRFQVLASLAVKGPATANELAKRSDIDRSTITSELPRLYQDKMAGRTKRETFEDVFKYWIRPEGYRVVEDVVNNIERAPHEELHALYGGNR